MAECTCCAVSAGAAWGIALRYTHMKTPALTFNVVLISLMCGTGAFCLSLAQLREFIPLCSFALFLLETLAVQLQRRGNCGDTLLAVLLAQGLYSLLTFTGRGALPFCGGAGYLLSCFPAGVSVFLAAKLNKHFPEADWRDYDSVLGPERIRLKARYHYWIAAILCLALTSGSLLVTPDSLPEVLAWSLSGLCLYWFGIALTILMYAYRKERLAVLLERQYRGEMQSFMNVIRAQRHDYNFHVQTIASLIRKGKIAECERYVNALEEDTSRMNTMLPIRDPAIAAMIHNFQAIAAREGIELRIDVQNDLAQIATGVYETNKIISNLLQNAIDETAAHKDKSYGIALAILKRGEYCVIRVSNALGDCPPTAEELGRIYQQGYTTKQGHEGVGLSSIRLLAQRYHGTVFTQLEGNIIHFTAKIPIDCTKEPDVP